MVGVADRFGAAPFDIEGDADAGLALAHACFEHAGEPRLEIGGGMAPCSASPALPNGLRAGARDPASRAAAALLTVVPKIGAALALARFVALLPDAVACRQEHPLRGVPQSFRRLVRYQCDAADPPGAKTQPVESLDQSQGGSVLDHAAKEARTYDVVVLDPPKFVRKRSGLDRGLNLYREVNLKGVRVLRAGGTLITCSCSQHVRSEHFEEMLGIELQVPRNYPEGV